MRENYLLYQGSSKQKNTIWKLWQYNNSHTLLTVLIGDTFFITIYYI